MAISDGTTMSTRTVATMRPKTMVIAMGMRNCACRLVSKISGVNPHGWMTQTLVKLANGHPANSVGELMPWIAVA